MDTSGSMPAEAPAIVAEAVADARAEGVEAGAAVAAAEVEAVAAAAAERVAAAEAAAQAAGDALAMTAICQRIDALEKAIGGDTWQRELFGRLEALTVQTAEAMTKIATILTLLLLEEQETEPATGTPSTPSDTNRSEPGANPSLAEDAGALERTGPSGRRRLI